MTFVKKTVHRTGNAIDCQMLGFVFLSVSNVVLT